MDLDYPKDRLEVILVNNNSTDSTAAIAETYPITLLHEEGWQSSYLARNHGIERARGEILAFTDVDCFVSPKWLKYLLLQSNNAEIGCFAGKIEAHEPVTLAEQYAFLDEENHNQLRCLMVGYLPCAQTANVAYRREVFDRIGLFNPAYRSGGDVDFSWRMVKDGKYGIVYESEALVFHKHRVTMMSLYRQTKKYGQGFTELQKTYPGHCVRMTWFMQDIFRFMFQGLISLPKNLYRYFRGKVPAIDVWFYFIKAMNRIGLVHGIIRAHGRGDDGQVSRLRIMHYLIKTSVIRLRDLILYHENSARK